jgi:3-hydroxyethyl bacteriochlorophyllide a dehydrogenase
MKTRALLFVEKERVEIGEAFLPELGPLDVMVRSVCSGLSSGTEGWLLADAFSWGGNLAYPVVPGYQRAGFVEAIGTEVKNVRVGQRVAATTSRLEGSPRASWGGHVHFGVTECGEVFPLDDRVTFANAAQLIVAQVGLNAAERGQAGPGRTALVLGDGCIGQAAAQAVRALGSRVILAGHRAERLNLGLQSGASEILSTRDMRWKERLRCAEDPVALVIDTVQNEDFLAGYVSFLPPRCDLVLSGFSPAGMTCDLGELQKREIGVLTVSGWTQARCRQVLEMMADGRMDMEGLLTHRLPASEGPEAFRLIRDKTSGFLGCNLMWE